MGVAKSETFLLRAKNRLICGGMDDGIRFPSKNMPIYRSERHSNGSWRHVITDRSSGLMGNSVMDILTTSRFARKCMAPLCSGRRICPIIRSHGVLIDVGAIAVGANF